MILPVLHLVSSFFIFTMFKFMMEFCYTWKIFQKQNTAYWQNHFSLHIPTSFLVNGNSPGWNCRHHVLELIHFLIGLVDRSSDIKDVIAPSDLQIVNSREDVNSLTGAHSNR